MFPLKLICIKKHENVISEKRGPSDSTVKEPIDKAPLRSVLLDPVNYKDQAWLQ